jgi:hypothetical protein
VMRTGGGAGYGPVQARSAQHARMDEALGLAAGSGHGASPARTPHL